MRIPTDRDQLFRWIATNAARVLTPLDDSGDVSLLWVGLAGQPFAKHDQISERPPLGRLSVSDHTAMQSNYVSNTVVVQGRGQSGVRRETGKE